MDAFRQLFHLHEAEEEAKSFQVRGFEADIRKDAERLVGRAEELETLYAALAAMAEGVLWVWGPAGIGKSYLIARLAAELLDRPLPRTLVLPYRFKVGDDRCARQAFLQFAIERLEAWEELPPAEDQPPDADRQPRPLDKLRELLRHLQGRRVLFILDGLDEIAERDTRFAAEVVLGLKGPSAVWLCAGRPERGLPEIFTKERAVHPFAEGLPPMDEGDIRTLLLEKIGLLRQRLVKNDREDGDRIINPFVQRVADAAKGLPLYVKYVVGDILGNRLRALDAGERLPPSLEAYHEELLRRCAVGTLHQVMTPLAATLAAAKEPLTVEALTVLLAHRTLVPAKERGLGLVRQGLSAIASMLRRALTLEGTEGYTLFHHSLREHMARSETTCDAVDLARQSLCQAAMNVEDDAAAPYLYPQGIAHLLETGRIDDVLSLLTDFSYLMTRLRRLPDPGGVAGLSEDWRAYLNATSSVTGDARLWEAFFREREHILRRGDELWPAYCVFRAIVIADSDGL